MASSSSECFHDIIFVNASKILCLQKNFMEYNDNNCFSVFRKISSMSKNTLYYDAIKLLDVIIKEKNYRI